MVQNSSPSRTDCGISTSSVGSQKSMGKKLSEGINSSLLIGITWQSVRSLATLSQLVIRPLFLLVFCWQLESNSLEVKSNQSLCELNILEKRIQQNEVMMQNNLKLVQTLKWRSVSGFLNCSKKLIEIDCLIFFIAW